MLMSHFRVRVICQTRITFRVCLLLQDLLQSCSWGGEEESGGHVL
jgi:hypothetical protein